MSESDIIGVVSKKLNRYLLTADDGTEYQLLAINKWETLPEELYTEKFANFVGERVKVTGRVIEKIIWNALIRYSNEKDNIPPKIGDLKAVD
ncbi:MAG: hypothetical protein ACTSQK_10470 [Candidatus Heimdallarchaeota archaeon]